MRRHHIGTHERGRRGAPAQLHLHLPAAEDEEQGRAEDEEQGRGSSRGAMARGEGKLVGRRAGEMDGCQGPRSSAMDADELELRQGISRRRWRARRRRRRARWSRDLGADGGGRRRRPRAPSRPWAVAEKPGEEGEKQRG
jgi:hypothetical protein